MVQSLKAFIVHLFVATFFVGSLAANAVSADVPAEQVSASAKPHRPSPNEALAAFAKEIIIASLPPEYEKRENWGHQKEITSGYEWQRRDGRWHFVRNTKRVNDGLWREVHVKIENPERNLQLRFTKPQQTEEGRSVFTAFLTAKLALDARQEQWRIGIKGLNFHVQGDVTVEVRLDVELAIQPVPGGSFGTIEIKPQVTGVGLRLVDLTLKRLDLIHGDLARELGNAFEDIVAGELRKKEPEVAAKINKEIKKNQSKLQFSPSQIAEIGWEKMQLLLGATSSEDPVEKPKKKQNKQS